MGESQLDKSLLSGKTVVIDNFNARNLNMQLFNENLDGVVIDVSFISLTYILKQVSDVIGEGAYVIALIKPQFECENRNIGIDKLNGIRLRYIVRRNNFFTVYKHQAFIYRICRLRPRAEFFGKPL